MLLLRVRSKVGTWRVEGLSPQTTVGELKARVLAEHHVTPHPSQRFSLDPGGQRAMPEEATLEALGLRHGDLVHLAIREEDCAAEAGKKIAADGTIVNKSHDEVASAQGFRPGMRSLRSMKMHWTLTDFVELDSQFEFKIKAQKEPWCTKASMEAVCGQDFQSYMRRLNFEQCRMGYLYGTVDDKNEVRVEALYEPPQEGTHEGFELLEDPRAERVEELAAALRLKRVGWIFAHPPREKGFVFSGLEVLTAAAEQLEAAQGVQETPFVTIRVSLERQAPEEGGEGGAEEGKEGKEGAAKPAAKEGEMVTHFDAFQVSEQCMQMAAEGAIELGQEPGSLAVSASFTAIVEGRAAKAVDNNFFLVNVPIGNCETQTLVNKFPRFNRADELPSQAAMKQQLSQAGKSGWTLIDLLADFHLLLFLTDLLGMDEVKVLCRSVVDRGVPLGEGHVDLLRAIAGME